MSLSLRIGTKSAQAVRSTTWSFFLSTDIETYGNGHQKTPW